MLRQKNEVNQVDWNPKGKGLSSDSGIGSKAVKLIRDSGIDVSLIEDVYNHIVSNVSDLTHDEQKAVLLSAASEFTLDSLIQKSNQRTVLSPKISKRDQERIDWIRESQGDEEADRFTCMLIDAKNATRQTNK